MIYENRLPYVETQIVYLDDGCCYIKQATVLTNNNEKLITRYDKDKEKTNIEPFKDYIGYRMLVLNKNKNDETTKQYWAFIQDVDLKERKICFGSRRKK